MRKEKKYTKIYFITNIEITRCFSLFLFFVGKRRKNSRY